MATRITGLPPRMHGRLASPAWCALPAGAEGPFVAHDLVQHVPHPGSPASLRTEARVLYDDRALYVGVRMYDPAPDSILAPLLRRDDEGVSDWVFVELDSRDDGRTAFSFGLNPRGVQVDGTFSNDVNYDYAWDGVWEGVARIDSVGWTAEFRIPFSQLPHGESHVWGLNVYRFVPHRGESANWSPRLPTLAGIVSHFNDLVFAGLPPTHAPVEMTPFVAASRGNAASGVGPRGTAGADLRAWLTPGLQLSASVRPDFGQVEADPSLINLTAFQTFFPEQRPLFVQGADAFGFGRPFTFVTRELSFADDAAFYSRRIGAIPAGALPDSVVVSGSAAMAAPVLGAGKVAGRIGAWTVGLLDAWTAAAREQVTDSAGARTPWPVAAGSQYAIARVARDWRHGQTAVGALASVVQRSSMPPSLSATIPDKAVVLGLDARDRFDGGRFELDATVLRSRVAGRPAAIASLLRSPVHDVQRPDATYLDRLRADSGADAVVGTLADLRLAKAGGGAWTWSVGSHAVSPGFDMNDAGFQRTADWVLLTGSVQWERYPAHGPLQRIAVGSNESGIGWDFGGERRAAVLNAFVNADLSNYWGGGISVSEDLPSLATEYLRGGPGLLLPGRTSIAVSAYSDQRRSTQLQLAVDATRQPATRSSSWTFTPTLDARISPSVEAVIAPSVGQLTEGWQYVATALDRSGAAHYVLGHLSQLTASLTFRATVALSPRLSVQTYAQPFLGAGRFAGFGEVVAPRAVRPEQRVQWLSPTRLTYDAATGRFTADAGDSLRSYAFADPAFSVRDFNANVVLRWEFWPGSTLFLVWTQSRSDATADLFDLTRDVRRLFAAAPANVFLVKTSCWLPF